MKVVIIYDTMTGNNELISKAVEDGVKSINGVEVQRFKMGTKFPISILKGVDAFIVGSPSIYGNISPKIKELFTNLHFLQQEKKLSFQGVKGAAFGSYEWDGGWHVERIERELLKLGVEIVAPLLSIADQAASMTMHRDDLNRSHQLGKLVAQALTQNVES